MRRSLPPLTIISATFVASGSILGLGLGLGLGLALALALAARGQMSEWATLCQTACNAEMKGDSQAAVNAYKRALPFAERIGVQSPQLAETLLRIAANQAILQQFDRLDNTYERGFQLALAEKKKGTLDKDVLESLDTLSHLYARFSAGPYQYVANKRRCEIIMQFFGLKHPKALEALSDRADTSCQLEKYKEAKSICRFIIDHESEILPRDRPGLYRTYTTLAVIAEIDKDYGRAKSHLLKAVALLKVYGPDALMSAGPRYYLGRLCLRQGKTAEAHKWFGEAKRITAVNLEQEQKRPRPNGGTLAGLNNCLANIYFEEKDYQSAEPYFRKTLAYMEKTFGPYDLHMVDTGERLAKVLRARGKTREAAKLESRSKIILARHLQEAGKIE